MVITFSTRITVTFFTFCQFNTFLLRLSIDIYYFIWYILLLYSLYLFLSSSIYWIYSHIIGKIITIFFYFIFFFFFFFFYILIFPKKKIFLILFFFFFFLFFFFLLLFMIYKFYQKKKHFKLISSIIFSSNYFS